MSKAGTTAIPFDFASADFPTWAAVAAGGIPLPGPELAELVSEPGLLGFDTLPADPDDALGDEFVVVALVEGLAAGLALCDRFQCVSSPWLAAGAAVAPVTSPVVSALVIRQVAGEY